MVKKIVKKRSVRKVSVVDAAAKDLLDICSIADLKAMADNHGVHYTGEETPLDLAKEVARKIHGARKQKGTMPGDYKLFMNTTNRNIIAELVNQRNVKQVENYNEETANNVINKLKTDSNNMCNEVKNQLESFMKGASIYLRYNNFNETDNFDTKINNLQAKFKEFMNCKLQQDVLASWFENLQELLLAPPEQLLIEGPPQKILEEAASIAKTNPDAAKQIIQAAVNKKTLPESLVPNLLNASKDVAAALEKLIAESKSQENSSTDCKVKRRGDREICLTEAEYTATQNIPVEDYVKQNPNKVCNYLKSGLEVTSL